MNEPDFNQTNHWPPATGQPSGEEGMPPPGSNHPGDAFSEQLTALQTLRASRFHQHFLERFLEGLGRQLRLPWWAVHALLYVLTLGVFAAMADVRAQFPRTGYWGLLGFLPEYIFTTFMLWHLRECRRQAFLVVAQLPPGPQRLHWLRRYWAPMHWGWMIPWQRWMGGGVRTRPAAEEGTPPRLATRAASVGCYLPAWGVTVLLLGVFYASLFWPGLHPGPFGNRDLRFPHEWCVYTDLAKTAMIVVVLANFWVLRGFVRLAWSSDIALNRSQRRALLEFSRRSALRLACVVGMATGLWFFAYGLDHGFTRWSWWWSFWLAVLFSVQAIVLQPPKHLASLFFKSQETHGKPPNFFCQTLGMGKLADWAVVLLFIFGPVALNSAGAKFSNLL